MDGGKVNAVALPHQKPAGSSSSDLLSAQSSKPASTRMQVSPHLWGQHWRWTICAAFSIFFFFLEKVLLFSVTQKPNRILHTNKGNCPAAKPACLQSGPVPAGGLWNKKLQQRRPEVEEWEACSEQCQKGEVMNHSGELVLTLLELVPGTELEMGRFLFESKNVQV